MENEGGNLNFRLFSLRNSLPHNTASPNTTRANPPRAASERERAAGRHEFGVECACLVQSTYVYECVPPPLGVHRIHASARQTDAVGAHIDSVEGAISCKHLKKRLGACSDTNRAGGMHE